MKQKDELIDALRERLSDLEAPVDPGMWAGIQARMAEAAIANGTDPVTELFRDGLKDAEAAVDPGAWSNISSQLGHPAAAGTIGVGAWVGGGIAAAVVVGGLWWGMSANDAPAVVAEKQPVVMEQEVAPPIEVNAPVQAESTNVVAPSSGNAAVNTGGKAGSTADPVLITGEPTSEVVVPAAAIPVTEDPGTQEARQPAPPPVLGPHFDKVQAIIAQEAAVVVNDPQPQASEPDRAIPTYTAPTTDMEEEAEVVPTKTDEVSLFIPNVFTPNNDGVNDRLEVSASGVSDIRVSIYSASSDRLMYRATDLAPWDGRDPSGVLCPEGYYFYAIEATGPDGKPISKGTVVRLNTH